MAPARWTPALLLVERATYTLWNQLVEDNPEGKVSSMASTAATRSRGFELTDCLPSINLLYTFLWYNNCTEGLHSLCLSPQTKQVSPWAIRSNSREHILSRYLSRTLNRCADQVAAD